MNIKSTNKEIKDFALVIGIAFIVFLIISFFKHRIIRFDFAFLSLSFFTLRCFAIGIKILKPLQIIWMTIAHAMGFVMNRILLSIVYFLVLSPIGIIGKLLGKDFIDKKIDKNKDSYWIPRDTNHVSNCESQY